MHVILLGATGATGKHVLEELLQCAEVNKVTTVTRQALAEPVDDKITQFIVPNFDDLESADVDKWRADCIINAIGTSRLRAGGREPFAHIERDYSIAAMKMAKKAGVQRAVTLSSVGANKNMVLTSLFNFLFYLRVMGEKENAMLSQGFKQSIVFQPGSLDREIPTQTDFPWMSKIPQTPMSVSTYAKAIAKAVVTFENKPEAVITVTGNKEVTKLAQ